MEEHPLGAIVFACQTDGEVRRFRDVSTTDGRGWRYSCARSGDGLPSQNGIGLGVDKQFLPRTPLTLTYLDT
jgi:hypothetical protein